MDRLIRNIVDVSKLKRHSLFENTDATSELAKVDRKRLRWRKIGEKLRQIVES